MQADMPSGSANTKLRILVAKPGLDGHDRGAKVAMQEAVDAVGLSILSGAHMTLFPAVLDALRARGAGDVLVFGGGIIPEEDEAELKRLGVAALFKPGTSTRDIIDWVEKVVRPRAEASRLR